jgi:hypothetical protein
MSEMLRNLTPWKEVLPRLVFNAFGILGSREALKGKAFSAGLTWRSTDTLFTEGAGAHFTHTSTG